MLLIALGSHEAIPEYAKTTRKNHEVFQVLSFFEGSLTSTTSILETTDIYRGSIHAMHPETHAQAR